ncbi:DNA-binding transcriptional LysR family regulator [Pseudomonas tolaasii]
MGERMDWNDLQYFLSVAHSGSLTQSSVSLDVSQSTVSRRIVAFEAQVGMTLFARHQTGYFLTDEGREMLRHALLVEDSILSLERRAASLDKTVVGTVRVATSESLATELIIAALPAFQRQHPGIRLEIMTSTAPAELGRREADIALRVVRPTHGNLKLRRVGHMTYSVYASADYLARHRAIGDDPVAGRHFIAWDEHHAHLPSAIWLARHHPHANIALVTSSLTSQIAAACAGVGMAIIPDFLARQKNLIAVIPSDQLFSNEVWLVSHADIVASARIRAVSDFLADVVQAEPALAIQPLTGPPV